MHVHLPKPLHGWRAFVGEVGIIVVGVLIALGAEQVVESIHEREDIAQLRGALRGELADDRARWEDMRAQDRCTESRFTAIDHWLRSAPAGKLLPDAFRITLWNMHSSAWDLAKTSPAVAHIPVTERLTYASLFAAIDNWREVLMIERANGQTMEALLATADQPENRRQVPLYLARARILLRLRQLNYRYFFSRFDSLGIRADRSQLTIAGDDNLLCKPLDQ
jgi:hypothetical protein